jgi:hypothetical protein
MSEKLLTDDETVKFIMAQKQTTKASYQNPRVSDTESTNEIEIKDQNRPDLRLTLRDLPTTNLFLQHSQISIYLQV